MDPKTRETDRGLFGSRPRLGLALILLLAVVPYLNALSGEFVWDDVALIAENDELLPSNVGQFFLKPFLSYYRPLVFATFAVEKWAFGHPLAFHLVNLLLHLGVTLLLFGFLRRLTGSIEVAGWSAACFACLPVHTEAVTWIAGRGDLLATLFGLGSLWAFLSWSETEKPTALLLAFAGLLLGLFSKEVVVVLPLLWGLIVLSVPRIRAERLWLVVPGLLTVFIFFGWRSAVVSETTLLPGLDHLLSRGLTFLSVLPDYLAWSILPTEFNAYRMPPLVTSPFEPGVWAGVVLLLGGLWAAGHRSLRFGVGAFFLPLIPVSDIVPLGPRTTGIEVPYLVAERWLYLPSTGLCLLVGFGLAWWWRKTRHRKILAVELILVGLLFGLRVWERNQEWLTEEAFYETQMARSPRSVLLPFNDGVRLVKEAHGASPGEARRLLQKAEVRFLRAVAEPDRRFVPALFHLGRTRLLLNRPKEAIPPLREFLESWTGNAKTFIHAERLLEEARNRAHSRVYGPQPRDP